jgi:hypothetical protein
MRDQAHAGRGSRDTNAGLDGPSPILLLHHDGQGQIGIQARRLTKVPSRLVMMAGVIQDAAEHDVRPDVVRGMAEGLARVPDRVVEPAL